MMWIGFLEPPKFFGAASWNITWYLQQWRRYMKDIYYLHKNHAKYYGKIFGKKINQKFHQV